MRRFVPPRSVVVGAVGLLLLLAPISSATAATDLMPDLGMGQLRDFSVETSAAGRRQLRFTAQIVNVGYGPFEVVATRTTTAAFNPAREECGRPYYSAPYRIQQRIYSTGGGFRNQYTPFTLCWGGDGHGHWHMRYLQRYELLRADGKWMQPARSVKSGFCFFDNARYQTGLPEAPQQETYVQEPPTSACRAGEPGAREVKMGLSVGWGDDYHASLPDQYIDVTGLQPGRYRLKATADPSNWLREAREDNNVTYAEFDLTAAGIQNLVVGDGAWRQQP